MGAVESLPTIKAIETVYNGYRFRSRLEARWAVFFDSIKIAYEYENQGFEIGGAGKYLPDFFLPTLGIHVEVKPSTDFFRHVGQVQKLVCFAVDGDMPLLLIVGTPGSERMALLSRKTMESWETLKEETQDLLAAVMEEFLHIDSVGFCASPLLPGMHLYFKHEMPRQWMLEPALVKARQARFEHGQTPKAQR